ncbi:MAG: nucleotidyltransferase domain-containing protein, partial [bacterium]
MGTELLGFEVALYNLLRVGPNTPSLTPPELWPAILTLADREHVAPLVHAAIDASGAAVPDSVRQVLAQSYRRAGTACADAYAQLAEVLRALHRAGVDPVLLKGAALARFTYADAALRPFGDLDILVRPEHVEAAHHALRGAGYTIAGDRPSAVDITWRHARGYADAAGRRIPVDLHWRYDGYPLLTADNYAGVFARAHPVDVDGEPALIPAPEDMLLALGIHFARDLWYG